MIDQNNNYTIIQPSAINFDDLITDLKENITTYTDNHLFVDISDFEKNYEINLLKFDTIATEFKKANKTFVIICKGISIDNLPEQINITPTIQEAEDILEMENIERDLGF